MPPRSWLTWTASWLAALAVVTLAASFYWLDAWQHAGRALAYVLATPALPWALCLAILPATVYELGVCRSASSGVRAQGSQLQGAGRVAALAVGLLVLAGLVIELPSAGSAWQRFYRSPSFSGAQGWAGAAWAHLDVSANGLRDQLYLRYYDRRAPDITAVPPAGTPAAARTGP